MEDWDLIWLENPIHWQYAVWDCEGHFDHTVRSNIVSGCNSTPCPGFASFPHSVSHSFVTPCLRLCVTRAFCLCIDSRSCPSSMCFTWTPFLSCPPFLTCFVTAVLCLVLCISVVCVPCWATVDYVLFSMAPGDPFLAVKSPCWISQFVHLYLKLHGRSYKTNYTEFTNTVWNKVHK